MMGSVFQMLVFAAQVTASPLSDAGYLRKLSYHLRGVKPTSSEFNDLVDAQRAGRVDAFLAEKIDEYANSPRAADRMAFRLAERFQVLTPLLGPSILASDEAKRQFTRNQSNPDAMTDIFTRLVSENLPWDSLLTETHYNLHGFINEDVEQATDFGFFKALRPDLPDDERDGDSARISFKPGDLRVAGVLTTARFVNRYATTNVNKNRRRAAAVFRIFLCDPMFPVIPQPADRKGAAVTQAYSEVVHGGPVTEKQLLDAFTVTDEQRHGADKRCVACHYKLDPMGKTFQAFGVALGPTPTPGALRYAGQGGRAVNERVRGIGELGATLVRQPEYVRCQVSWFWTKFIGVDVPLTPERLADLSARFDQVGRRTNDFVRTLVTSPEFRERPRADDRLTFQRVSPYLQRCDSCHAATNALPMFSAGNIPSEILGKMRSRINLPAEDPGRMPLDWATWDPKELELVKRWVNQAGSP